MTRKAASVLSAALATLGISAAVQGAPLVSDTFTYADGALETVSGGLWELNSGSGSKLVAGGKLVVDDNTTADYQRQFTGAATTTLVYASYKVNFSSVDPPNSQGSYLSGFAGPKSGTSFSTFFRARVAGLVIGTEGAGKFTLGISSGGNLANDTSSTGFVYWGTPLDFDTEYTIVTKYDGATGENRLWVNPTLETDTSVVHTVASSSSAIGSFLWRTNSSSIDGDKTVDDLNVGTTFADAVIPEPTTAGVLAAAGVAAMLRRRRPTA